MDAGMSGFLLAIGIGAGTGILVSLFAKLCPKEKTYDEKILPIIDAAGVAASAILGRWVGEKNAEKIEEGILKTIGYWLSRIPEDFFKAMERNNTKDN